MQKWVSASFGTLKERGFTGEVGRLGEGNQDDRGCQRRVNIATLGLR